MSDTTTRLPDRTGSASTARDWALVASPLLAGLLITAGALADPAAGISGKDMYEIYGNQPDAVQFKSFFMHWGYAFFILPALLIPRLVHGRGSWLANIAAALGFTGLSTLPGLMFVDFYDSATSQLFGAEGTESVVKELDTMWGVVAMAMPGALGSVAGPVLAAAALWRAGLSQWWAPIAVLFGFVAFNVSGALWWGGMLLTVFMAAFSWALASAVRSSARPLV